MTRARTLLTLDPDSASPESRQSLASWYAQGFSDGLGDRLMMFDNTGAASLELLRFRPELTATPSFEDALRRRADELDAFSHPSIAKVRKVEWLGDGEGLALVSNHTTGRRLSEIVQEAHGPTFAMELIRQLTPALAALQQHGDRVAHGALTADRIIVTPEGRLVIVEHVLGAAIESLRLPAFRLRARFGMALPPGDHVALDSRADVIQLGFIALSLLVGRRLDPFDYPSKSERLLDEFAEARTGDAPISPHLHGWLERALQFSTRTFETARQAEDALADVSDDRSPRAIEPPGPLRVVPIAAQAPISLAEAVEDPGEVIASSPLRLSAPEERRQAPHTDRQKRVARWMIATLSAAVAVEAVVISAFIYLRQPAGAPALTVESPRPGAEVFIDGRRAGLTPLKLDAASGVHSIRIVSSDSAQPAATAPSSVSTAQLEITSEPAGARVTVDGTPRGVTPLTIASDPGRHAVVISNGTTSASRVVTVAAGGTATVMASLVPAGASAGWVAIQVPVELQVREGGSLVGTTSADRIMLPAGHHVLELSNASVGFHTTVAIDVRAGKTVTPSVSIPNGSLSINAAPWANVWIDGQAFGTTPLANVQVPIGTHEIVFRNPQLGERRQTVVVGTKGPVRLGMDFKK
jgi:hypothetical protein